jgi:hypothetical protein
MANKMVYQYDFNVKPQQAFQDVIQWLKNKDADIKETSPNKKIEARHGSYFKKTYDPDYKKDITIKINNISGEKIDLRVETRPKGAGNYSEEKSKKHWWKGFFQSLFSKLQEGETMTNHSQPISLDMVTKNTTIYFQDKSKTNNICPKCGVEVKEGQKFCGTCGDKISINSKASQINSAVLNTTNKNSSGTGTKVSSEQEQTEKKKSYSSTTRCPSCGSLKSKKKAFSWGIFTIIIIVMIILCIATWGIGGFIFWGIPYCYWKGVHGKKKCPDCGAKF